MGAEFWTALVEARSFWKSIVPPPAAIGLVAGLVAILLLRKRATVPLSQLVRDSQGAASVLDLVLVAPVFTLIVVAFLQWAILLNDTIMVHYAAFAAARSARVYLCPTIPTNAGDLAQLLLDNCSEAKEKYTNAARFALIPASPSNPKYGCDGCQLPADALRALAQGLQMTDQTNAWLSQASYAFDPANLEVEASVPLIAEAERLGGDMRERPVTVTVKYRHVLMPVVDQVYRDGYLPDGTGYVVITAQMTLI